MAAPTFRVEMVIQLDDQTQAPITIEVHPEWAPLGAGRFRELVECGYYDGCRFHRVVKNFMAQVSVACVPRPRRADRRSPAVRSNRVPSPPQVGICGDPSLYAKWSSKRITDDATRQSNSRGMVTFATSGPDARTCQVFFNLIDNDFLDDQGFAPFARVLGDGMSVVDRIYNGYGEAAPKGRGPEQQRIKNEGDAYLKEFPKLSFIASAKVID